MDTEELILLGQREEDGEWQTGCRIKRWGRADRDTRTSGDLPQTNTV